MKLSTRDAAAYFAKPDPRRTGLLIFGDDAARVALRRSEVIANLAGPDADAEMRLTRIAAADLRREPALLLDAVKATGFFPGPRVAFVDGAADGLAPIFDAALQDWRDGDAQIIATAGALRATSKLRKLFEAHPNAFATGIYDEPPGREEVERLLRDAGLPDIPRDAMATVLDLAKSLEPGDFRQTIEKVGLYKRGDPEPLSPSEIAALAPLTINAAVDDAVGVVAGGEVEKLGHIMRRLQAQGVSAVQLCIAAERHFRQLHQIASDPGGPGAGIGKLRPPVWGPRRDAMQRQASRWSREALERALALLLDTDLTLRSSADVPALALVERALLRIAWMARR